MKAFILFQWDDYDAQGGLGDITGDFDTRDEAVDYAIANRRDQGEIVERDTWAVVLEQGGEESEPMTWRGLTVP